MIEYSRSSNEQAPDYMDCVRMMKNECASSNKQAPDYLDCVRMIKYECRSSNKQAPDYLACVRMMKNHNEWFNMNITSMDY